MNNELRADFEDIVQDTALEHNLSLPKDFVDELYSQLLVLFGDCQEFGDEE